MSKTLTGRLLLFCFLAALVASYFVFDLVQYFTLEYLKEQQHEFIKFYHKNQLLTQLLFFQDVQLI